MRAGKANLQKERLAGRMVLQPPLGQVADEVVGVRFLGEIPGERAEALVIVGAFAVKLALLLDQAARPERLVPLVVKVASLKVAILVFDDIALVKAALGVVGERVHFADVDAVVAALVEQLDPAVLPCVGVFQDTGGVRIIAGKEARPCAGARRRGDMAVPKCHPLLNETVEVRGVNVVKAQRVDGVQTLLVRDDEDDVRTVVGHNGEGLATLVLQNHPHADRLAERDLVAGELEFAGILIDAEYGHVV